MTYAKITLVPKNDKDQKINFLRQTSGANEAIDAIVRREVDQEQSEGKLKIATRHGYGIIKNLSIPATIGAALGYLATGTIDGAIDGSQQGALAATPFTMVGYLIRYLKNSDERENFKTEVIKAYLHAREEPLKYSTVLSLGLGGIFVLSSAVIDGIIGVPASQIIAAKIGLIRGATEGISQAFRGSKYKKKILEEIEKQEIMKEIEQELNQ